jgi:ubiquinone/menaquinone biosynthesis C-methylase UbiE
VNLPPRIYELVQTLTGARISEAKIREILGPIQAPTTVLDAGGGTGIMARVFSRDIDYCCMDIDLARVRMASGRGASGLVGDGTHMPVRTDAVDLVIMRAVSHHLGQADFEAMTAEASRVLKPDGCLLFLEPTWDPAWLPGRLLWRFDQGSHPRTEDQIRTVLGTHFAMERATAYSVYHRYYLAVGRPHNKRR